MESKRLFVYEKEGVIGKITLKNPPLNALTTPVFGDKEELKSFLESGIKAVLLAGAGRHFSSGADPDSFSELFQDPDRLQNDLDRAKELLQLIRYAPIPVMAVVSGSCFGAGLEIALCCHYRYGASSSMYGFPESTHGLIPGLSGTVISKEYLERGKLIELILSGKMIGAEEACGLGIIDAVCPVKKVKDKASTFLMALVENHSLELIRATMESVHNSYRLDESHALKQESRQFCKLAKIASDQQEKS